MKSKLDNYYIAYATAYSSKMEKLYTEPKIYSAKGDLKKRWYVYYSFIDPATGKMVRQPSMTMSINRRFKTVKGRMEQFKLLQKATLQALKDGFSPYEASNVTEGDYRPAKETFLNILNDKKNVLKKSSFTDYKIRVHSFIRFLEEKGLETLDISKIDRVLVNEYLDQILNKTGARNRNNHKTILSSIFSDLCEKGFIEHNFILNIRNLKNHSQRDATINTKDLETILKFVKANDHQLYMYLSFVSYFFLRPLEVCRLKVKDINLSDKVIYVEIKQKEYKTKIIPDLMLNEVTQLIKNHNKECFLFTSEGVALSLTELDNRRSYFSRRFRKVRDTLKLPKNYTVYSFRHTYITKVYKELRKEFNQETSLSKLRLITGHTSDAIYKYIHYIDAELPEDYSDLLK